MSRYTSPLDNIHIASPCPADWNQMFGDERKRFCGDCKLNVYNLSDMTRHEAENLIISSEGRLCVRFFRRADGTVLTKNCPVGWAAVKRRAARVATAVFSIVAGFITGVLGFNLFQKNSQPQVMGTVAVQGGIRPYEIGDVAPGGQYATTGMVNIQPSMEKAAVSPRKKETGAAF